MTNPIATAIDDEAIPPRPSKNDESIKRIVAHGLAVLWHKHDPDATVEEYENDLMLEFRASIPADGYLLARALESGYDMDTGMVNLLDAVSTLTWGAVQDAVREWVKTHNIAAPYPDGTRVRWRHNRYSEIETGVIDPFPGFADHAPEGVSPIKVDGKTTGGRCLVEWEKLEGAQP